MDDRCIMKKKVFQRAAKILSAKQDGKASAEEKESERLKEKPKSKDELERLN